VFTSFGKYKYEDAAVPRNQAYVFVAGLMSGLPLQANKNGQKVVEESNPTPILEDISYG
jgi:hypothetical protein